jgi:CheY-like chemotaxis protein
MTNVLLVEDDQDIREALTELLQDEGYAVSSATNGEEALELLDHIERPSLILLDLVMPKMDGVEFLEHVKRTPHAQIPVVVLSASATVKPPPGTPALMKPVALESVLAAVREHCP